MKELNPRTPGRIEREIRTVGLMIELYCQAHHKPAGRLCPECEELYRYAMERLSHCPFAPEKPVCAKCPVHCYREDMRDRIREVMRYSGPRMLWHYPILSIRHFLDEISIHPVTREKK